MNDRIVIIGIKPASGGGAVERVTAVVRETSIALQAVGKSIHEEMIDEKAGDIKDALQRIKEVDGHKIGHIVITSEPTAAALADAKTILGDQITTVLTAVAFEKQALVDDFKNNVIDIVGAPAYGLTSDIMGAENFAIVEANRDRVIETAVLPIAATAETTKQKRKEWHEAAEAGKVQHLPEVRPGDMLVMTILPGNLPGKDKPFMFTEAMAVSLAKRIGTEYPDAKYLVTNGPRTSNIGADGNPTKTNLDGLEGNPVTKTFVSELSTIVGADHITLMIIDKGKAPGQGFLAGIDLINEHAENGGAASVLTDGASAANHAEQDKFLHQDVGRILIDTPAPKTMQALMGNMTETRGAADFLPLAGEAYGEIVKTSKPGDRPEIDDAKTVAAGLTEFWQAKQAPAPTRSAARSRKPDTGPTGVS